MEIAKIKGIGYLCGLKSKKGRDMFFFSRILGPFHYAASAYVATRQQFPIEADTPYGKITVRRGDKGYDMWLKNLYGDDLKKEHAPHLKKARIREDLILVEHLNGAAEASLSIGTNLFVEQGDAMIFVSPGLQKLDKRACGFEIKRQVATIKNNDNFMTPFVAAIASFATALFSLFRLPFIQAWSLVCITGIATEFFFGERREAQADDFAISESSDEELKGGRRLLIACAKNQAEENKEASTNPRSFRITKIETALKKRGVVLNEAEEGIQIEKLRILLKTNHTNLLATIERQGGMNKVLFKEALSLLKS